MTESAITKKIQLAMQEIGVTLWRNNVGACRVDGRVIRYGLAVGSSDLVGCDASGVFVCVEVKTARGRLRERQKVWRDWINRRNGIAIVARSAEEAVEEYHKLKAILSIGVMRCKLGPPNPNAIKVDILNQPKITVERVAPATIRPMLRRIEGMRFVTGTKPTETEDQP